MTLIYAQRTANLVYFLADTFAEEGKTAKQFNWFSEPILKVIRQRGFVIAFAGNSYLAQQCVSAIEGDDLDTVVAALCESSSSGNVEYATCHIPTNRLIFIKDGVARESTTGYLGSKSGREMFQRHRMEKVDAKQGQMHVVRLIDDAESSANDDYSTSLSAFKATLIDSDGSFGGVAISYTVCNARCEYGTYTSLYRGPVSEAEMPLSGWGTIPHQDSNYGAYRVEVWGSEAALAIYFPDAALGHMFSSERTINIEPNTLRQIDGYDFTDAAIAAGCGVGGVATWRSWQRSYQKTMQHLLAKDCDRAARRIAEIEDGIKSALKSCNPSKSIAIDLDFAQMLQACGKLNLTIDTINAISTMLELRYLYCEALCETGKRDICHRQAATWKSWVEAISIEMRFD